MSVTVHTSSGPLRCAHFVGQRGSGKGFAVTPDHHVLEVVEREGAWRAVRRVNPSTLPEGAQRALGPALEAAREEWAVGPGDTHRYVVVAFGSGAWSRVMREHGLDEHAATRSRRAAIAAAQSLFEGGGSVSCVRVLLVPVRRVPDADIAGPWPVVWQS